jgi:transketolase
MRKKFAEVVEKTLELDENSSLFLGDIGVFAFRNSIKNYPNRVFNIGILEQSMVGIASGFAKNNITPIVHTIAPFLVERAYEQLKIDFGYQNLVGTFVTIGNSYDYGSLGPTHHCPGDVSLINNIPNFNIIIPGNSTEFGILFEKYFKDSTNYFRLSDFENKTIVDIEPGKGKVLKLGKKATIVCVGNILDNVLEACLKLDVTILYYNVIKPFDEDLLIENFNENIILCEPYFSGTLNHQINKTLSTKLHRIMNIGVPNIYLDFNGSKEEIDKEIELDVNSIRKKIINYIND